MGPERLVLAPFGVLAMVVFRGRKTTAHRESAERLSEDLFNSIFLPRSLPDPGCKPGQPGAQKQDRSRLGNCFQIVG